ncbi:hypothetical protein [Frankia sp. R82]|uniref:AMIN-like domain-containing (lipo)protein n=1 Tax=Frankia sp. R82 TaxID=2950553 RepID=UPI0020435076|nr:hypothetical protein [Frankia sp. R82]MCM3882335.1 hypothetical protein [Frankia sp. R82]
MSRSRVTVMVLGGLLLALAGCGRGSSGRGVAVETPPASPQTTSASPSVAATHPPSRPTGRTSTPSPTGKPTTAAWSVAPRHVGSTLPGSSTVVALRAAHNAGGDDFDRLVIEFRGGVPGYDVRYVPEVRSPGRGEVVALPGRACLEVVLFRAVAHDQAGSSTLRTPRSGGGLPTVVQYRMTGDYEGYVHLGLGVSDRVGFRVLELANPPRLAIDLAG